MKKQIIASIKIIGAMTLLLGVIYPLLITAIAQIIFPEKANGSLIEINKELKGSLLIGQRFDNHPGYFNPRPSASGYDGLASGGSNLSLTNKELYKEMQERKAKFMADNKLEANVSIPSEMLFASASGLDPHIPPDVAKLQVKRIAEARNFSENEITLLNNLIDNLTEQPQFGIFGNRRVNVFVLNLELDKLK